MATAYGNLKALRNNIIVRNIDKGEQITKGGIIIADDDGKDRGIKPRWAQVYRVGKNIDYVKEGQWILMEHGRWGPGLQFNDGNEEFDIRLADTNCILGTADERPEEVQIGRL